MGRKSKGSPFVFQDSTGSTSSEHDEQITTSDSEGYTTSTGSSTPLKALLSQGLPATSSLNCFSPTMLADQHDELERRSTNSSMPFPYQNSDSWSTSWESVGSPYHDNNHHHPNNESNHQTTTTTTRDKENAPTPRRTKRPPLSPRDDGTDVSNLTSGSESSSEGFLGRFLRPSSSDRSNLDIHPQDKKKRRSTTSNSSSNNVSPMTMNSIPEENDRAIQALHWSSSNRKNKSSPARRRQIIDDILGPAVNDASPQHNNNNADTSMTMRGDHSIASAAMSLPFSESDQTPIIRNTSGDDDAPMRNNNNQYRLPKPRFQPPSGLYTQPDSSEQPMHDKEQADPIFASPRPYQERRRLFCSGTQGIIVCLLITLFIFGLISVVVSLVLAGQRAANNEVANDSTTEDGSTALAGAVFFDDDLAVLTNPLVDDAFLAEGSFAPSIVMMSPTQRPTGAPSLRVSTTTLAGEVLLASQTTANPTLSLKTTEPTKRPTLRPTTAIPATALPTSLPATLAPTTMQVLPPLLTPEKTFQEELYTTGRQIGDTVGYSTALSGNGRTMVAGAPSANNVYVYYRRQELSTTPNNNGDWIRIGSILASEEATSQFGYDVATSYDGNLLAVSEPTADDRRGRVRIYEWSDAVVDYVELQILEGTLPGDHFGITVSMSDDGTKIAIGSPYYSSRDPGSNQLISMRGKVDVFELNASSNLWTAMGSSILLQGASNLDWFGWSVSFSQDGELLAIGAPRNSDTGGYVQCYQLDEQTRTWGTLGDAIVNTIEPVKLDDRFGHVVSLSKATQGALSAVMGRNNDGGDDSTSTIIRLAIGAPWKDVGNVLNSGLVTVYEWSGSSWSRLGESVNGVGVIAEYEPEFYHQFGYTLKLAGDVLSIGVPGYGDRRGLVGLYWLSAPGDKSNGPRSWEQLESPLTGVNAGDDYGFSVSMSIPTLTAAADSTAQSSSWLMLAVGAIMVTTTAEDAFGYTKVYETSTP